MFYAVIDTNVIVSALITKRPESPVLQVMQRIFSGRVCALVNEEILAELQKHCMNVDAPPSDVVLPDPKDVVFYNVVLAKRDKDARLVTGNIKHFPVCDFVVTPREFLDIVDMPTNTMFLNDVYGCYRP